MIEVVDSGIETFEESVKVALTYLTQTEGPLILIGVSDDTTLRDHFIEELTRRLPNEVTLRNFVFDRERLSLYEGAVEAAESAAGRVVVCCTGLENLSRDKQSEAVKLLNAQRNRLGYTRLAVFLWLNQTLAHARAAQFRRNVAEFSGIFLERGVDQEGQGLYGFLHLTFEEYFAAVRLCELWEREGHEVLKPLMHNPRWNEVILLAAGRLGGASQYQATRFVRAVFESGDEYEDVLHRDLFLAARCLGDGVRVDRELRSEIVNRLCKLYFDSKSPWSLCEDIRKTFALLGGATACDDLVKILLERLSDTDGSVRHSAANAIGALGENAAREEVIAALLERFSDDDESVRRAAAYVTGNLKEKAAREEVIAALLERLSDADRSVRRAAANVIGALGEKAAREEVIVALLERLSDPEKLVRAAAASALGSLGEKAVKEEIIVALLECLSDADWAVRAAAASALGALGEKAAREEVIAALLERLSDAEWDMRYEASKALGGVALKVQSQSKSAFTKLILPHARNKRRGDKNDDRREAGYVALRNLMAAGVSEIGEAA